MGRVTRNTEEPLMTACEVARYLMRSCGSLREFESYMFGSSLFGVGSDFDILIVGPSGEPLSRLKAELRVAANELPLDVLYMLPAEAEATEFVVREGCITLALLAASSSPRADSLPSCEQTPNPSFQLTPDGAAEFKRYAEENK